MTSGTICSLKSQNQNHQKESDMTVIAPANMNDEALIKEIFHISSWEKSR